ncbi:MAG: chloride channel protein [Flavobacteriales bacterium]|nr:chloride channel protein [Flavobacteriales bacterium]
MKKGAAPLDPARWQRRLQLRITGAFVWLGKAVMNSKLKELTLLTLPYQVAAVITALIAVGYAKLFDWMEGQHHWILQHHPNWVIVTVPIGFLISWFLVKKFSPFAGGSGIPQLMAAIEVADDKNENDRSWKFLNARIIVVKIFSSLAMVVGGGAVGREGPTLQIAGSVYRVVHKLLPPFWPAVSRRVMMITGGAAGLSAAFNTPLGGIVFAVEELTKTHLATFRTAVLTSVIIAGMTAQQLMGNYLGPFLGYPRTEPVGGSFMYKVLVIGLVAGAAGALFCKLVLFLDKFRRGLKTMPVQAGWCLVCAAAFLGCYQLLGEHVLGSGRAQLQTYLFDEMVDPTWRDIAARLLAPLCSFSAGGAGGIFGPSLSSGAVIGGWVGQFFDPTPGELRLMMLTGMVAFLTGVSRSPFTSAILVLEMTDRHSVIFQLMYAAMVANLIATLIDKKPYYERMKERMLKAIGVGVTKKDEEDKMAGFGLG